MIAPALPPEPGMWCLVANVVRSRPYGHGGEQTRPGVRLLGGGAKVYLAGRFHCMGSLSVVGLGRSRRLVNVVVRPEFMEHWRLRQVYRPSVLRALAAADAAPPMGHRYRQALGLDGSADIDQGSASYRTWLLGFAHRWPDHFPGLDLGPGIVVESGSDLPAAPSAAEEA